MKIFSKEDLIRAGIDYYIKYNKQPTAKSWTIKTAGCSRDRVYEQFGSWPLFISELSKEQPQVKKRKSPSKYLDKDLLGILKNYYIDNSKSPTKKRFLKR